MSFKRFLKRQIPLLRTIDTVKNIVDEGSLVKGVKRTVKEDYCEDNPVTSAIYRAGQYDGKVEGYAEASEVYEAKLIDQAQQFLAQKKLAEDQIDAYKDLLDDYEQVIDELSSKVNRSEEENAYLQQLLILERQLRKLDMVDI